MSNGDIYALCANTKADADKMLRKLRSETLVEGPVKKPVPATDTQVKTFPVEITGDWTQDASDQAWYCKAKRLVWSATDKKYATSDDYSEIEQLYAPLFGTVNPALLVGESVYVIYRGRWEIVHCVAKCLIKMKALINYSNSLTGVDGAIYKSDRTEGATVKVYATGFGSSSSIASGKIVSCSFIFGRWEIDGEYC